MIARRDHRGRQGKTALALNARLVVSDIAFGTSGSDYLQRLLTLPSAIKV